MKLKDLILEQGADLSCARTPRTSSGGLSTVGSPATVSLGKCYWEPTGSDALKPLPEGRYTQETQKLFTTVEVFMEREGFAADRVTIDGAVHEVIAVDHFVFETGDEWWEAVLGKVVA